MKVLKEDTSGLRAWMMDKNGDVYIVKMHPYFNYNSMPTLVYSCKTLYEVTTDESIKKQIIECVRLVVDRYCNGEVRDLYQFLKSENAYQKTKFISNDTEDFINSIKKDIENVGETSKDEIMYYAQDLTDYVANNYCMIRTGNLFKLNSGSDTEVYFRILSDNFNWFTNIWKFVYEFRDTFDNVTIVKEDRWSAKREYCQDGSNVFKNMPTDEFITLSGRPVVEEFDRNWYIPMIG